ncbi:MAG: hypothetical protein RJA70_938 [Pseudomonadota bacterium]
MFDLDGTLIDSREDIAAALNHTLALNGHEALSLETVCRFVGDGARELVRLGLQLTNDDPLLPKAHADFLDYYAAHAVVHTRPYDGVIATLAEVSSPKVVCTNKPRVVTERVLEQLGLGQYFVTVVCGDDFPEKKPSPEPLFHIAQRLQVPPEALVMVGDGPQDILCGKAAGAVTVGVTYGIHPEAMRAAEPDYQIESMGELLPLLTRLAGRVS